MDVISIIVWCLVILYCVCWLYIEHKKKVVATKAEREESLQKAKAYVGKLIMEKLQRIETQQKSKEQRFIIRNKYRLRKKRKSN